MSRLLFGAFAVMCFLLSGTANAALYSQLSSPFVKTTFTDPVLGDVNVYLSQNDGGLDPLAVVYDNFKLASNASVGKISWVGAYLYAQTGILPNFQISFFENGLAGPGTQIATRLVTPTTETAQLDVGYFLYTADINLPIAFTGGVEYWVSVMAYVDEPNSGPNNSDDELWGWAITNPSAVGDDTLRGSFQDQFGTGFPLGADLAFSLDGTSSNVIPEPMSALVFVGLIGGMAIYRRKKAISANAS